MLILSKQFSPEQAATECGVTKDTIKQAIRSGRLKAEKVPVIKFEYRIDETDLSEWQRKKRRGRPLKPRVKD
jgi:excisionase family DNA binding protein